MVPRSRWPDISSDGMMVAGHIKTHHICSDDFWCFNHISMLIMFDHSFSYSMSIIVYFLDDFDIVWYILMKWIKWWINLIKCSFSQLFLFPHFTLFFPHVFFPGKQNHPKRVSGFIWPGSKCSIQTHHWGGGGWWWVCSREYREYSDSHCELLPVPNSNLCIININ